MSKVKPKVMNTEDLEAASGRMAEESQPVTRSAGGSSRGSGVTQKTRLVVKEIEVENFKSYYGKHRIGPFHKTFTAVIGPNGSGKSNVIDSILFVFGRNAKKIRLEKLSELIHNSAAHPNVGHASVTIHFVRLLETEQDEQCPDQRVELSGSEISIRREVYRTGASQYYLDGSRSTQKEVEQRLIMEGVDLEHNRFLILQGEVEQIALMKPKGEKEGEEGLLEYLDDLIGTNRYVEPIQKLSIEAEEAQTMRLEALGKEKKLLQEREALDDAKNTAIAFVSKENQQKKTLIAMCQLRMQSTEESLVEPRKLLAEIDGRIKTFEEDLERFKAEKSQAEELANGVKKEMAEQTRLKTTMQNQKEKAERSLEVLKSGAAETERARQKLNDQVKKATSEAQKALVQQQDAEREAAVHLRRLEEAKEKVSALQQEHETLSAELLPVLCPLRQKLDACRKAFTPFEEALASATEECRSAEGKLAALTANREKGMERLHALEAEQAQATTRIAEIEKRLEEADRAAHVEQQQRQLQAALLEASQRKYGINSAIQEKKLSVREGEADDRSVDFLLSQRSLKGYYGTLRQLGRIDEKYDIAAGVASNAWGFHVVEDRQTATAALTLLKKENVGRASMMVLQEVLREQQERMAAPFTSPSPKATRLFDLIRCSNDRFRAVFYQAVRDTLVVSTLAEAREVAFRSGGGRRYRVVTLKGELVEPSGFITGGGGVPRGAKLKAARSSVDRQAILEELKRQQGELQDAVEEERALQLRLQELNQATSPSLTVAQRKAAQDELRQLQRQQKDFPQKCSALEAEVAAAQKVTEEKHRQLSLVLADRRATEAAEIKKRDAAYASISQLEQEIEAAGGERFRMLCDALQQEKDHVEVEETALRSCRRLQEKSRVAHERREADVKEYEQKIARLDQDAAEGIKEQVASEEAELRELLQQLETTNAVVAETQQRYEEARAALPVCQAKVLECQKQLDDEQRYRQGEAAKMASALQQLAKYEQKIDGCEETIKNNVEQYGVETLQIDVPKEGEDAAEGNEEEEVEHEGAQGNDTLKEVKEEAASDEPSPTTEHPPQTDLPSGDADSEAAEKSPRSSGSSKESNDNDSNEEEDDDGNEEDDDGEPPRQKRRVGDEKGAETSAEAPPTLTVEQVKAMSFRLSPAALAQCDYNRCRHLASSLVEELERLRSEIDLRAVTLWWERDSAHRQAKAAYLTLKERSDKIEKELHALKQERKEAFMKVFVTVQAKIKEVYQLLTHGGDADLELVDASDPFEGINFVVRPPRKPWRQISFLSGGEKTLSSLALIFSLHHVKPTPVYVMDEIDAALDFRNVSIVANYVLGQATGAQFIIISLRNNMFELAHQLVGVCKVNDITSTLVLMPRAFQQKIAKLCEDMANGVSKRNRLKTIEGADEDMPAGTRSRLDLDREATSEPADANERSSSGSEGGSVEPNSAAKEEAIDGGSDQHASGLGGRLSGSESARASRKSIQFGLPVA